MSTNFFAELFNWHHVVEAFLLGIKENLVLLKDGIPIFLLIIYVKLNEDFKTILSRDFELLLATALGTMLFISVFTFIGAPHWRVRWLCMISVSFALYALPNGILYNVFGFTKRDYLKKIIRSISFVVAIIWLSYNIFFTYIYTNIDVKKWLEYRHLVLNHNPDAMKELGGCTLPKNRPKGIGQFDQAWGSQDDRYRCYSGPTNTQVRWMIKNIWNDRNVVK